MLLMSVWMQEDEWTSLLASTKSTRILKERTASIYTCYEKRRKLNNGRSTSNASDIRAA